MFWLWFSLLVLMLFLQVECEFQKTRDHIVFSHLYFQCLESSKNKKFEDQKKPQQINRYLVKNQRLGPLRFLIPGLVFFFCIFSVVLQISVVLPVKLLLYLDYSYIFMTQCVLLCWLSCLCNHHCLCNLCIMERAWAL